MLRGFVCVSVCMCVFQPLSYGYPAVGGGDAAAAVPRSACRERGSAPHRKVARMNVSSLGHWGRIYSLIPLSLAEDLEHGFIRGDSLGIIEQTGEIGGFTIPHKH